MSNRIATGSQRTTSCLTSSSSLIVLMIILMPALMPSLGRSLANAQAFGEEKSPAKSTVQTPENLKFFEGEVKPLLQKHCIKCHGGEAKVRGKLFLTFRKGLLQGGESGPAIDSEKPEDSLILEAINYEGFEMPPKGKLPENEIAIFTKWVKLGAPMTKEEGKIVGSEKEEPKVTAETREFWSFRPIQRPVVPKIQKGNQTRHPIDCFLQEKLQQAGVEQNSKAKKTALLRRATYDLTGLPPTPDELKSFLNDKSEKAFEKVLDQLLASPHYGEKWGRHWLDLVRYAESNSYERDNPKPFVWRYRDYVIRAFNEDKPIDQFIKEQIAGDEFHPVTKDSLIATGYYRLGIWDDEPVDAQQALYDDLDDIVTTTGQVFLGLTVNCARCHNHKLDPFSQEDYYSMLSFFRNIRRFGVRGNNTIFDASVSYLASPEVQQKHQADVDRHRKELSEIEKKIQQFEREVQKHFIPVEKQDFKYDNRKEDLVKSKVGKGIRQEQYRNYVSWRKLKAELNRTRPASLDQALVVKEHGSKVPETFVLVRGTPGAHGKKVEPRFPLMLSPPLPQWSKPPANVKSSFRRTAFANWLASSKNPLTARVFMNRVWQYHFGRGIVRSPNNFGLEGEKPTHPLLLDWLAAELIEGNWKLKRMHKLIMMSDAYQMSSTGNEQAEKKDPVNNLFWRFNPRRLTAEELRDSILAVNGSLNQSKMYGPSIYTEIPAEVLAGQSRPGANWGKSSVEDRNRRSIYIHVKRSLIDPMLANFDFADTDFTCPVRFSTVQPTQALGTLNSDFILKEAKVFAEHLKKQRQNDRERVAFGLEVTTQRPPTESEIDRGMALISELQEQHKANTEQAWQYYCLVLLNLNEFLYLD